MSNRQRILVIDDDVQVVDTVETLLQSVGYETFHAYRTEDGMALARKDRPDLILLDVMFSGPPGPDGFETSRLVQGDPALKGIPIIMLSGVKTVMGLNYDFSPDDTWLPIKAFLEKPLRPDRLLREIAKVLGPREEVLA
jgi:twitching motility two-component system response regulator PilH